MQNDPKILSALLDKYEPQKCKAQDQVRTAREKEVLTPKTITALPNAMLKEHLIQRGLYTKAFGKKQALISALQESCQPSQRPTTPQEQHTPDLTSLETTNLAVTRNVIWQLTKLDLTGELKSHRDPTIGNAIELKTRLFHKMQNDQEIQIKLKQKYSKETKNALKQVQEARNKQTLTKKEIKALRQSMLQEHLIQRGLHTKAAGTKAAMARALQDFYYPPKTPVGEKVTHKRKSPADTDRRKSARGKAPRTKHNIGHADNRNQPNPQPGCTRKPQKWKTKKDLTGAHILRQSTLAEVKRLLSQIKADAAGTGTPRDSPWAPESTMPNALGKRHRLLR